MQCSLLPGTQEHRGARSFLLLLGYSGPVSMPLFLGPVWLCPGSPQTPGPPAGEWCLSTGFVCSSMNWRFWCWPDLGEVDLSRATLCADSVWGAVDGHHLRTAPPETMMRNTMGLILEPATWDWKRRTGGSGLRWTPFPWAAVSIVAWGPRSAESASKALSRWVVFIVAWL